MGSAQMGKDKTDVVMGTFPVNSTPFTVLFDSGATHSFISIAATDLLGLSCPKPIKVQISLPSGDKLPCSSLLENVEIKIEGVYFPANLIMMELNVFDIILGMDWLGCYKEILDCE